MRASIACTSARPPRQDRANLWVWSPIAIPLQHHGFIRWINRAMTRIGVGFWTSLLGLRPKILWTYSPLTTEFYRVGGYPLVVYHAVDDIKAQPGMPREVIAAAERTLAQSSHIVFTTSENLQANLEALNPNTFYFPNVADYRHFSAALDADLAASLRALLAAPNDWIITSSEALRGLAGLVAQLDGGASVAKLQQQHLIVPHARIAETASALGFNAVTLTGSGDERLLAALQSRA